MGRTMSHCKSSKRTRGLPGGPTAVEQQDLLRSPPDWEPYGILSKLKNHPGSQFSHLSNENLGILVNLPGHFSEAKGSDKGSQGPCHHGGTKGKPGLKRSCSHLQAPSLLP